MSVWRESAMTLPDIALDLPIQRIEMEIHERKSIQIRRILCREVCTDSGGTSGSEQRKSAEKNDSTIRKVRRMYKLKYTVRNWPWWHMQVSLQEKQKQPACHAGRWWTLYTKARHRLKRKTTFKLVSVAQICFAVCEGDIAYLEPPYRPIIVRRTKKLLVGW